ncbi:hypothetical protein AB0C81_01570 [Streptomyces roseoverticillatus]|uniref:effector-associated constant component EACC1 n=1 Tax=Streptomyces roseoverticillatus TaxID=66429 RepID=UPI0033E713D5
MNVQLQLVDGDSADLTKLWQWLNAERELRGHVHKSPAPIDRTQLGGLTDLLTVAVGAGGAGTVLASSLITWIRNQRTRAKVTITANGRRVTFDITTAQDISPLLHRLLDPGADDA